MRGVSEFCAFFQLDDHFFYRIQDMSHPINNQDFHVVLVKRGNFNQRQSTTKTLERGSSMLFL
jgi:hypothetical protein